MPHASDAVVFPRRPITSRPSPDEHPPPFTFLDDPGQIERTEHAADLTRTQTTGFRKGLDGARRVRAHHITDPAFLR